MATTEREQMVSLLNGLDKIVGVVARGRVYVALYLDETTSSQANHNPVYTNLKNSMLGLYSGVLEFLIQAHLLLLKSGAARVWDGMMNPGSMEDFCLKLKDCEADVMKNVENCERTCSKDQAQRLDMVMESLKETVGNIDSNVKIVVARVKAEKRTKILNWISPVSHALNHDTARKGHTHGTGDWLLQHSKFRDWAETEYSRRLWLHGIRKSCLFIPNTIHANLLQREQERRNSLATSSIT